MFVGGRCRRSRRPHHAPPPSDTPRKEEPTTCSERNQKQNTNLRVEHADVRVPAELAQALGGGMVDDLARVLCDQLIALKVAARVQAVASSCLEWRLHSGARAGGRERRLRGFCNEIARAPPCTHTAARRTRFFLPTCDGGQLDLHARANRRAAVHPAVRRTAAGCALSVAPHVGGG